VLRDKLAKQGVLACETRYDWKTIMPKYDALLESLVSGSGSRPLAKLNH